MLTEISSAERECLARLRGTTVEDVEIVPNGRRLTLRDNGNRYHLYFTESLTSIMQRATEPKKIVIVPNQKICNVSVLPTDPSSKNIPDAMRKFRDQLHIHDPNWWLDSPKKRHKKWLASQKKVG